MLNINICIPIHNTFSYMLSGANAYSTYLESLQNKEETKIDNPKIIDIFAQYIMINETNESYCLLEKMIEQNMFDSKITKKSLLNKNLKEQFIIYLMMNLLKTLKNFQRMIET